LGDLDQTHDFRLGAEFAIDGIATDAAAHDNRTEAYVSPEAILENLQRLLDVLGLDFDGNSVAHFVG
jgi:hypothetical protein